MIVAPADSSDLDAIAALVNAAYRGGPGKAGWTTEAALLAGQRTDAAALRRDLAGTGAVLLTALDEAGALLGCVRLEPETDGAWHLGLLTVAVAGQGRGLGRALLGHAEAFAKARGAVLMRLSAIQLRHELIAWYERRGYRRTGAVEPFPYDDPGVGVPLRPDLHLVVLEKPL